MFTRKINHNVVASLVLGLTVILAYSPVTLFGHSYNVAAIYRDYNYNMLYPADVTPFVHLRQDFGCSSNCSRLYAYTIEYIADGNAIWPVARLAANLYSRGTLPLWNPYLGAGTPLEREREREAAALGWQCQVGFVSRSIYRVLL